MRFDNGTLILLGVGLVLIASGRRVVIPWGDGWVWPVPPARYPDGSTYVPVISQEYRPGSHLGVDVMYRRRNRSDRPEVPRGPNGTLAFFAPPGTPVVAARDAAVWSVDKSPRGWQIVLDHGKPFATYYQHLSSANVAKGDRVVAGQQIGMMGGDPLDAPQHLRHLHFAVWYKGAGDAASVDAAPMLERASTDAPWDAGKAGTS